MYCLSIRKPGCIESSYFNPLFSNHYVYYTMVLAHHKYRYLLLDPHILHLSVQIRRELLRVAGTYLVGSFSLLVARRDPLAQKV